MRTPVEDVDTAMKVFPVGADADEDDAAGGVGVAPREMVIGEAPRLSVKDGVED